MTSTKLSVHVFTYDGNAPDFNGKRYCVCGLIETHPRHEVPLISEDQLEMEARRLGENVGEDE